MRDTYPHPHIEARDAASDHDGVLFAGTAFTRAHAEGSRFLDCLFEQCDFSAAAFDEARFVECELREVHAVQLSLANATVADSVFEGCRLGAVEAGGSQWRDVRVVGGRIDYLNLRGAQLRHVAFTDCVVADLDVAEADLAHVTFDGCTLERPDFGRVKLKEVDLRGAQLREPTGIGSLRGATMSRGQVIDLAEWFAHELGVNVTD